MKAVNLSHELHYRIPRLLLKVDLTPSPRPSVSLTTEQNMIVLEGICQRVAQYPRLPGWRQRQALFGLFTPISILYTYHQEISR